MDTVTATIDLTTCDREPIHIPGSIQPHGRLLVLGAGPNAGQVVASAGFADGQPFPHGLDQVLDAASAARVRAADAATLTVLPGLRLLDGTAWHGLLHGREAPDQDAARPALLELEPSYPDQPSAQDLLATVNEVVVAIPGMPDVAGACAAAAAAIQGASGFDRVMVYRFASDWAGEVVAEALAPGPPASGGVPASYQGLHFPATDIPVQARALYARFPLRLIPDARYRPAPLRPDRDPGTGRPIDLSPAVLRSVSPVHLEYLANMGVHASMSVSVLRRDGTLWGLIACHHTREPRFVGHDVRQACQLAARALSWRLAELDDAARGQRTERARTLHTDLLRALEDPRRTLAQALQPYAAGLLGAVGASGLVLGRDGDLALLGATPPEATCRAVLRWLDQLGTGPDGGSFSTDRLPERHPGLVDPADASGMLALRLGADPGSWIAWLRPELPSTVTWAGNPDKAIEAAPAGGGTVRLAPRHSFAAWTEIMRGRSAAWSDADLAGADAVRGSVADALARRAVRLERENAQLVAYNEELGMFADAAAHDLKEPLWQIEVFGGMLREDLRSGHGEAAEMSEMAGTVAASAGRMRVMIDGLAEYGRAGRRPEALEAAVLGDVLQDAVNDMGTRLKESGATLSQSGPWDTSVVCNRAQLRRVFQNLISNAAKYRSADRAPHMTLSAAVADGQVSVSVKDNGSGFDPAFNETVFEPFRRVPVPGSTGPIEGSGIGLAICKRIVGAHGGRIRAEGNPGFGTTIQFTLPLAGPSLAHDPEQAT